MHIDIYFSLKKRIVKFNIVVDGLMRAKASVALALAHPKVWWSEHGGAGGKSAAAWQYVYRAHTSDSKAPVTEA